MKRIDIYFVLASVCVSAVACSARQEIERNVPQGWNTVSVHNLFTFDAPPSINEIPVQGIDSLVGKYEIDGIELWYDYGQYSSTLEEYSDHPGYIRQKVTVDGRKADIVQTDDGHMGIAFSRVPGGSKLTLSASYSMPESGDTVRKILESVQFAK